MLIPLPILHTAIGSAIEAVVSQGHHKEPEETKVHEKPSRISRLWPLWWVPIIACVLTHH